MTDRTTKILLGLIAAGLWANFATSFTQPATARSEDLSSIASAVDSISDMVGLIYTEEFPGLAVNTESIASTLDKIEFVAEKIVLGECPNRKIC